MNKKYKSVVGVSYALLVIKDLESDAVLDYIKMDTYDISPDNDDLQIQINDVIKVNLEIAIGDKEELFPYPLLFRGNLLVPSKKITVGDLIDATILINLPIDVVNLSVYRVKFDNKKGTENILIQLKANPDGIKVDLEYESCD